MTISSATSVKSLFETGDRPSQQDFTDFIDSTMRGSLMAIASGVENLNTGYPRFTGVTNVTFDPSGSVGRQLLNTNTTGAAANVLGVTQGGVVGSLIYSTDTTAAAQQQIGGGTVGRALIESAATASAQNALGAGSVGKALIEAITTASASNILNVGGGSSSYVVNMTAAYFGAIDSSTLSGSTYTNTLVVVSITPTTVASRMLVQAQLSYSVDFTLNSLGANQGNLDFDIFSNSTDLANNVTNSSALATQYYYFGGTTQTSSVGGVVNIQYLDSPSTTGSITYRVKWRSRSGALVAQGARLNADNKGIKTGISSIIVTEVGP